MSEAEHVEWTSEMKHRALAGLVAGTRWDDLNGNTRLVRSVKKAEEEGVEYVKINLQRGSISAEDFYLGVKTGEWTPADFDTDAARASDFVRQVEAETDREVPDS